MLNVTVVYGSAPVNLYLAPQYPQLYWNNFRLFFEVCVKISAT